MKLESLLAIALCICLAQICWASNGYTEKRINKIKEELQNKVHGVGGQFVEDITTVIDHTPSNTFFIEVIYNSLVQANIMRHVPPKQNNTKFDANNLSDFYSMKDNDTTEVLSSSDYFKILQSTLSKQLPQERYNGIINMFYIVGYPNATAKEIANTLNYVYGFDDVAAKVSYLGSHNIPDPVPSDCPKETKKYSDAFDLLKSMTDIKPTVVQDLTAIREKFPCNIFTYNLLNFFVNFNKGLHDKDSFKSRACSIIMFGGRNDTNTRNRWEYEQIMNESILSTRLSKKTFRGLLDVLNVIRVDVSTEEYNKAFTLTNTLANHRLELDILRTMLVQLIRNKLKIAGFEQSGQFKMNQQQAG